MTTPSTNLTGNLTSYSVNDLPNKTDTILRMPEVIRVTGLSKATIYRMMKDGTFPKQYRLSARAVGWKESSLCAWAENRKLAM